MNSRYQAKIAPLMLAIPLCVFVLSTASPAAAAGRAGRPSHQADSPEAQALAITETKLAALAKESKKDTPAAAAEAKKGGAANKAAGAGKTAGAPDMVASISSAILDPASTQNLAAMQEVAAPVAARKAPGKKGVRAARKARLSKARRAAALAAKADPDKKAPNVVDRRLTRAEVLKVLSTTRDFSGSDLSGMNLVGIDFSGAKFNRANLHMANLARTDLNESDLELADLSGADLRGASLNQARLRGTRLHDTRMEGALWVDKTVCKKGSLGICIE